MTDTNSNNFNFDSFFNRFILIEGGDSISTVVSQLSDEDFDALRRKVHVAKVVDLFERRTTEVKYNPYFSVTFNQLKQDIDTLFVETNEVYNQFCNVDGAKIRVSTARLPVPAPQTSTEYYVFDITYPKTYTREELEKQVVTELGKRKGKIIAKRIKAEKEAANPPKPKSLPPKIMVIDGVEYALTPTGITHRS